MHCYTLYTGIYRAIAGNDERSVSSKMVLLFFRKLAKRSETVVVGKANFQSQFHFECHVRHNYIYSSSPRLSPVSSAVTTKLLARILYLTRDFRRIIYEYCANIIIYMYVPQSIRFKFIVNMILRTPWPFADIFERNLGSSVSAEKPKAKTIYDIS